MAAKNIEIKVVGIKEVKKYIKDSNVKALKAMDDGIYLSAIYLKSKVQQAIQGKGGQSAVKSGRFLNSVYATKQGTFVAKVGSDLPYSIYLEEGTSPHFIVPKNAKALHWLDNFGHAFSKGHVVSGIKPRKYFGNTAKQETTNMTKIVSDNIAKALK